MKNVILWIVGEPGAGKTTVARAIISAMGGALFLSPKPKWTIGHDVCAAGHYTGETFDGADQVPYNGAAAALVDWEAHLFGKRLTILDGDRFSNANAVKFFKGTATAPRLMCLRLTVPLEIGEERRAARSSQVQNAAWVKGRRTKAERFAGQFPVKDSWEFRTNRIMSPEMIAAIVVDAVSIISTETPATRR